MKWRGPAPAALSEFHQLLPKRKTSQQTCKLSRSCHARGIAALHGTIQFPALFSKRNARLPPHLPMRENLATSSWLTLNALLCTANAAPGKQRRRSIPISHLSVSGLEPRRLLTLLQRVCLLPIFFRFANKRARARTKTAQEGHKRVFRITSRTPHKL